MCIQKNNEHFDIRAAIMMCHEKTIQTGSTCVELTLMMTFFAVFTIVDLRTAHARQCYVCGIGPSDPLYATMMMAQHGATSSTSSSQPKRPADCSQFEHADADADAYLVECPAGYMGCFTQSGGK